MLRWHSMRGLYFIIARKIRCADHRTHRTVVAASINTPHTHTHTWITTQRHYVRKFHHNFDRAENICPRKICTLKKPISIHFMLHVPCSRTYLPFSTFHTHLLKCTSGLMKFWNVDSKRNNNYKNIVDFHCLNKIWIFFLFRIWVHIQFSPARWTTSRFLFVHMPNSTIKYFSMSSFFNINASSWTLNNERWTFPKMNSICATLQIKWDRQVGRRVRMQSQGRGRIQNDLCS